MPRPEIRAQIACQVLFHPNAAEADELGPSDAVDFLHMVNLQPWSICERVQRGMTSRTFTYGWYAPMENPSLDIRRWRQPLMEG
jgi:glycine betaine catabolism A